MSAPGVLDPITRRTIERLQNDVRQLRNTLNQVIRNGQIIANHDDLGNLAYADSGHTGFASSAQLSSHTGDSTIHFTEASIDHTAIQNIGNNSHSAIDTHIADSTIHFVESDLVEISGSEPTPATGPPFWIDNSSHPWVLYANLENSSGTAEYVWIGEGRAA